MTSRKRRTGGLGELGQDVVRVDAEVPCAPGEARKRISRTVRGSREAAEQGERLGGGTGTSFGRLSASDLVRQMKAPERSDLARLARPGTAKQWKGFREWSDWRGYLLGVGQGPRFE